MMSPNCVTRTIPRAISQFLRKPFRSFTSQCSASLLGLYLVLLPINTLAESELSTTLSKISFHIRQTTELCLEALAEGNEDASLFSNKLLTLTPEGEMELLLHAAAPISEDQLNELTALGAEVSIGPLSAPSELELPDFGLVQAWVPVQQIVSLESLAWVVAVTDPGYSEPDTHPINPINSQGVALHRANLAHLSGLDGTGVTVGVMSDGVTSLAASQALNEMPANCPATPCVQVVPGFVGANDEGTAMLEIVHDMAPGANLVFASGLGGLSGHIAALFGLIGAGANVITEDLPLDAEPAFEQGLEAALLDAISTTGISVYSSAGNRGNEHAAQVPALGTGTPPDGVLPPFAGCLIQPANTVAIAPGGDTTFDVVAPAGTIGTMRTLSFTLQWSEPRAIFPTFGGGFTDLDLFVMDAGLTQCLGGSTQLQINGAGDTLEQVTVTVPQGTQVKVVVHVRNAPAGLPVPTLDLRWRGSVGGATPSATIDATTRAGSLNPDANFLGLASSTAAIDATIASPGSAITAAAIEPFSSGGPFQLGSTTVCPAGAYPCPGTAIGVPGALTAQPAPTMAGADRVNVSGVGTFPSVFPGTSAAAPHVAGCDALLRQSLGVSFPVAALRAQLLSTAIDVPPAGTDNTTGAGLTDCLTAAAIPILNADGSALALGGILGSYDFDGVIAAPFPIDLSTATVSLTTLLEDAGTELVSAAPISLDPLIGATTNFAVFGSILFPSAFLDVLHLGSNNYFIDVDVFATAISQPAACSGLFGSETLTTIISIDDGTNPPVIGKVTDTWSCFAAYMFL